MTNFEKIKQMSIDEMVNLVQSFTKQICETRCEIYDCEPSSCALNELGLCDAQSERKQYLNWLESEANDIERNII